MIVAGTLEGCIDGVLGWRVFSGWVTGGDGVSVTITLNGDPIGYGRPSFQRSALARGFSILCDQAVTDDDLASGRVRVEFRRPDGAAATHDLTDRERARAAPANPGALIAFPNDDGWLLNQFESLGRNCAFGHIQGLKKAAHLGLLRYSSIPIQALIVAMENRFAGVGDAEFTRVFIDATGEFRTSDKRYDMAAHTKILSGEVDAEDFAVRQMAKIRYLVRNLLEDIEAGDKILVVHNLPDRIADETFDRLRLAVRSIGPAPIMYVEAASAENSAGLVVPRGDGVFQAHVVSVPTEHYQATEDSLASWLDICAVTYRMARPDG